MFGVDIPVRASYNLATYAKCKDINLDRAGRGSFPSGRL